MSEHDACDRVPVDDPGSERTRKRILVIDDDAEIRSILADAFTRSGYAVVAAPNGKAGLEEFRQAPSDVVLTDILMPEMDGLETVRELRRVRPEVKIIALSGGGRYGNFTNLDVAQQLGASGVFQKPVSIQALLDFVEGLLTS